MKRGEEELASTAAYSGVSRFLELLEVYYCIVIGLIFEIGNPLMDVSFKPQVKSSFMILEVNQSGSLYSLLHEQLLQCS